MEHLASKEDTVQCLLSLGFIRVDKESDFFDSPGSDWAGSIVQVYVYQCVNGYYCVDTDGGYRAPVVWNDPEDRNSKTTEKFVAYLDQYFPGWK